VAPTAVQAAPPAGSSAVFTMLSSLVPGHRADAHGRRHFQRLNRALDNFGKMLRGHPRRVAFAIVVLAFGGCGDDPSETGGRNGRPADGATPTTPGQQGSDGGTAEANLALSCAPLECGPSDGSTVLVPAGGDLQAAIDRASPGDVLVLQAGATYRGPIVLRDKPGARCITLRSSATEAELPEASRAGPASRAALARIVTPGRGEAAVRTDARAHHYRLVGLEVTSETADALVYEMMALGDTGQSSLDVVPHHIELDRLYIHGHPNRNFKRGIGLNSASTCIVRSHVSDFQSDSQDSQAIGGSNGPGPFRIVDNRLEGAGENVMFGGATPAIRDLVPTGIELRGNHFYKPWSWRRGDAGNTGYVPVVKNLFEIKNARDVVLEGNVFENNWVGADQHGIPILFTPRGEDGAAPWASCENVRFARNVVRHVGGGVSILGMDTPVSRRSSRITIEGNLFEDIRADLARDIVRVVQFDYVDGLAIRGNTFTYGPGSWPLLRTFGMQTQGFIYENNVSEFREGVWSDCGVNGAALSCKLPGAVFTGNVLIGGAQGDLPAGNAFPASIAAAKFVDWSGGAANLSGYRLADDSPFAKAGTAGTRPGFDPAAFSAAGGATAVR
jgi:hypothetical protein